MFWKIFAFALALTEYEKDASLLHTGVVTQESSFLLLSMI